MVKGYSRRRVVSLLAIGTVGLAGCIDDSDDGLTDDDDGFTDDDMDDSDDAYDFDQQPEDARVSFVTPTDGDTVQSPVQIEAEVENVELVQEEGVNQVGGGQLHILVNQDCIESGEIIPASSEEDGIYHWSDGQAEGELSLEPGQHDLCIQISDGDRRAYGDTDEISITVE